MDLRAPSIPAFFAGMGGMPTKFGSAPIPKTLYSKIRVAVPKGNTLKWLFPQEKATFEALIKGTFTLVLL
jgi:hypothetical protein